MTFPYLLKICLRSVARVSDDKPDTHKLRLKLPLPLPLEPLGVGDGAVILVLTVVLVVVVVDAAALDDVGASGNSAIIRTKIGIFLIEICS